MSVDRSVRDRRTYASQPAGKGDSEWLTMPSSQTAFALLLQMRGTFAR
jgi:hypothetical protein